MDDTEARCLQHQDKSPQIPGNTVCAISHRCGSAGLHLLSDSQLAAVHPHLKARGCSGWAYVSVCQRSLTCASIGAAKLPAGDSLEAGERNEIWNVSAKNTLTMETFLAKTFQIPFCSSLVAGGGGGEEGTGAGVFWGFLFGLPGTWYLLRR